MAAGLCAFAPAFGQSAPYASDRVLVRFAPGAAGEMRSSARAAAATDLRASYRIVPGLELLKVRRGRTVEQTVAALRRNPNVLYAEPDFPIRAAVRANDPLYTDLWGLQNIRAPRAWDVSTGSDSVVVAILDTGIDLSHPDLQQNLWTNPGEIAGNSIDDDRNGYIDDVHGWDFVAGDNDPSDPNGHGTHVAGTVGARGNNSLGVVGVNWRVKLVALRSLGEGGVGSTSDAIRAFEYARDNGIRISNNSWGSLGYSQALYDVIKSLQATGHLAVFAAGNDSRDTDIAPTYPASYDLENVISVAAITQSDALAGFSNYGSKSVDLGAPGVSIESTTPGGGYLYESGTSSAAPHVTGAAALLLSRNPTWSYARLRAAILDTTRPLAALSGRTVTGGTLDVNAALRSAVVLPTFTLTPTVLDFGEQAAGSVSAARTVTLTNTGTLTLPIASIGATTNEFDVTHTCGESVAAGADCTISVVFKPATGGAKSAVVDIVVGGAAESASVMLSGTAVTPFFTLAPAALDFGEVATGGTSAPQTVTLTNTGTLVLPILRIYQSSEFGVTHTCGESVAAGASCTIDVVFKPVFGGPRSSRLSVTGGNAADGNWVSLKGTGLVPQFVRAPRALDFGEVAAGGISAPRTVTLTNTGTLPLPIASIHLTPGQGSAPGQFGVTHSCGVSVAVGASCPISVVFKPTAGGTQKATLWIEVQYAEVKPVLLAGTVPMQVENPPGALTVPVADTDGRYRVAWGASATPGVTYVLQESWDRTFAQGVVTVYTGPNLNAGMSRPLNGVTYYYRVRARTPLSESAWVYGANGCLLTRPIVVRLQLLSLPDVNASGTADLAVLRVDTRAVEIREGQNGAPIRTLTFLDDDFSAVAARPLPDLDGNGAPELALLGMRKSDQRGVVEIRDVAGSEAVSRIWLAAGYPPLAISAIEGDADDDGVPELAVLLFRESDGRALVQVQNASGFANARTLLGAPGYVPLDLEIVPDADNNGMPDLAVLATRVSDRRMLVQVRNADGAGTPYSTWFAQGQTAIDLAAVADKDADGIPEVAVLSMRDSASDGQALLEAKNAFGAMPNARALWTRPGYWAIGVKGLSALPGASMPRVAILQQHGYTGRAVVSVRDAVGLETPRSLLYPLGYTAYDLAIMPDVDENGIEEVAVLLTRDSDSRVLVQSRNSHGDPLPRTYWFAP